MSQIVYLALDAFFTMVIAMYIAEACEEASPEAYALPRSAILFCFFAVNLVLQALRLSGILATIHS